MPDTAPSKLSLPAVALILIATVAAALISRQFLTPASLSGAVDHQAVGTVLNDLRFEPLTGDPPALTSESLRGKVVFINLWATWCGPCRQEFPHLIAMNAALRDERDYQFISLNVDQDDTQEVIEKTKKFLIAQQTEMPTWRDIEGKTEYKIFSTIQGRDRDPPGIPLSLLLDRQGKIRGVWIGFVRGDDVEMENLIRSVLAEGKI